MPTNLRVLTALLFSAFFVSLTVNGQGVLVSDFRFNGSLADENMNGQCISFRNDSVTYTGSEARWYANPSFSRGGGFQITVPDNLMNPNTFTIEVKFRFNETNSYRKIIDFRNQGTDAGVYVNQNLRIYSAGGYGDSVLSPGVLYDLYFFRTGLDDSVFLYTLDGTDFALQSFGKDPDSVYVPVLTGSSLRLFNFFHDDTTTSSEAPTGGSVDRIRIWNGIPDIGQITGITSVAASDHLKLFPNPGNGQLTIQLDENQPAPMGIEVFDVFGTLVYRGKMERSLHTIDASTWAAGSYQVKAGSATLRWQKF